MVSIKNHIMSKKLLLATIVLSFISCDISETKKTTPFKEYTQLLDTYAKETIKKGNIPTIALAVYKDGEVYSNYYGTIEKGAGIKPNDSSLFEFASISKVFVGSLVARAVVERKLLLEDPVQKYLGTEYDNLVYEGNPITIKDLLTHTLGLKNRHPEGLEAVNKKVSDGFYEDKQIAYNMSSLLEELKLVTLDKKPGTVYEYNSVGPELLSYILGQIYEKSYNQLLQEYLNELGMNNTYLLDINTDKSKIVRGYNDNDIIAPLSKNPLLGGSAGMIGTLSDLVTFMKYRLESNDPLIKESTRELFIDKGNDDIIGYLWEGMGTGDKEGFYYSKTGTSGGTQSGLLLCPDSNYGVILIANNTSEEGFNDWIRLYLTKMENELIELPRLNLTSIMKPKFLKDKEAASKEFLNLSKDKEKYFKTDLAGALNNIAYDLMASEKSINESIEMLQFACQKFPENANLFDSLGEAYFTAKDFENSLFNYKKSLLMNPKNSNAKQYIKHIEEVLTE